MSAAELGVPVLGMVAGFLRGQRAGQAGHLGPDRIVQILLRGVDRARNDERHAEQTGPVLLRRQEVQLRAHLRTQTRKLRRRPFRGGWSPFVQRSHHLSVHGDDVADERALLHGCDVSVGDPVGHGCLRAAGNRRVGSTVGD